MAQKKRKKTSTSKKRSKRRSYSRRKKNTGLNLTSSNIIIIILGVVVAGIFLYNILFKSSSDIPTSISKEKEKIELSSLSKPEAIVYTLEELFAEYEILPSWISQKDETFLVRLPNDVPSIVFTNDIINRIQKIDCEIINSTEDLTANSSTLEIGIKDKVIRKLIITEDQDLKRVQGKIAIVIDDFGYNDSGQEKKLLQFPYQITVAIIPGTPKSNALYEAAQQNNKETIIHLPMEALEKRVEYSDYTLFENMSDEDVRQRVRKAIEDFPDAKGINNHMGSRVTANKHIMEIVIDELKQQNKYFIDSKTTSKSVAYQTAKQLNVPCAENNMFLERERNDNKDYLLKKLEALTKIASKNGSVLAIGHPYKNTINVLMEQIPKLEKQGFEFVPASEIVH